MYRSLISRLVLTAGLLIAGFVVTGGRTSAAQWQSDFSALATTAQLATSYTPDQIATAYDYAPLYSRGIDGTGQTIAMLEEGTVNASDLHHFDLSAGINDPKITGYYVGGKTFNVPYDPEATLDVEWAHALAPGAAIQLYYLNGNLSVKAGWKAIATALRQAAANSAGTVSLSFGICKPTSGYKAVDNALKAITTQGVTVFAASGDTGDKPGTKSQCGTTSVGVAYPASDPSVVSVGGTSLQLNDDNTIASETAWSKGGGGFSAALLRPVWQVAPTIPSGSQRWVPDVAFLANPATGVEVLYHGRWEQVGGTSLGAPAWAAAWSLIRQDAQATGTTLSAAPALIYRIGNSSSYATAFHDIVSGSNGKYSAGPGWDPVTGWGTPDVAALDAAIVPQPAAAPSP